MPVEHRPLVRHALDVPLGSASLAGFLRSDRGIYAHKMRILEHFALVYLIDGSGHFSDALGTQAKIGLGHLLLLFPDVAHAYWPNPGTSWETIYVVFNGPVFHLWRSLGLLNDRQPVRTLRPIDFWTQRVEEAVDRRGLFGRSVLEACRLQQLLADMLDHDARQYDDANQRWLASVTKKLQNDASANEHADWESVARKFDMTAAAFRKKFTKLAGVPPARFVARQVIARASRLMQDEGLSNKQIAEACGFCDEFHFSRRFKQVTGLTPRQFRQQHYRAASA